jgi:hypothetical protein
MPAIDPAQANRTPWGYQMEAHVGCTAEEVRKASLIAEAEEAAEELSERLIAAFGIDGEDESLAFLTECLQRFWVLSGKARLTVRYDFEGEIQ